MRRSITPTLILFLLLMAVANSIYSSFLYAPYPTLGKTGSLIFYLGLQALFCSVPVTLDLFWHERDPHLFPSVLLPFALYATPMVAERYRLFFTVEMSLFALFLLLPLTSLFIGFLQGASIRRCLGAFFRRVRLIMAGVFSISLIVAAVTTAIPGLVGMESWQEETPASAVILEADVTEASLELLEESRWAAADKATRLQVLRTAAAREADRMNIPMPAMATAQLSTDTLGDYAFQLDRIRISDDLLSTGTARDCLETALHELRHAYQHRLVEAYNQDPETYAPSADYVHRLEESFDDYIDGYLDFEGYQAQFCEQDARDYAQRTAEMLLNTLNFAN